MEGGKKRKGKYKEKKKEYAPHYLADRSTSTGVFIVKSEYEESIKNNNNRLVVPQIIGLLHVRICIHK